MSAEANWNRLAALEEVPEGGSKAVSMGDGRSIALFNVQDRIYATDNQCPHMGYPLTRGSVRRGVLTCDWHGRNFDLEGGGCFQFECDDLQTFPVEVRDGDIWVQVEDAGYRRKEEHLRLLWEGLLSADRWTMSKAIALLLKGGVGEEQIVELVLRHVGRHIASSHGAEGGEDVALLVNGLAVGRRYSEADRLIALTTAASAAAGGAAERLEVVPLPLPVDWNKIEGWVRMFSRDGQAGRIERCLLTARQLGEEEKILPLLFECAAEPYFIGFADNIISLGYLSEAVHVFGWEGAGELVFNLGAKLVGRGRGEPERFRRDAVRLMRQMVPEIDAAATRSRTADGYDEDAFVEALVSPDIERSFAAVKEVLESEVKLERIITTLVMLAVDRMARTPVNVNAGWRELTAELNLAASLRTVLQRGGPRAAARGLFHAAWLIFADRWLNIPSRPLGQAVEGGHLEAADQDEGVQRIVHSIKILNVQEVGGQALGYLEAGYCGQTLLEAMGRAILWDDTGPRLLPALRTVFEEWTLCQGHPAHNQLLVGLARYATDVRTNKESGSSTVTAMRFAEGRTTVEVFED